MVCFPNYKPCHIQFKPRWTFEKRDHKRPIFFMSPFSSVFFIIIYSLLSSIKEIANLCCSCCVSCFYTCLNQEIAFRLVKWTFAQTCYPLYIHLRKPCMLYPNNIHNQTPSVEGKLVQYLIIQSPLRTMCSDNQKDYAQGPLNINHFRHICKIN
jgi:hypothetical protein